MRHESNVERQDKFFMRQKFLSYLVFQLVVRHRLNVCDISTSACDKSTIYPSMTSNHVLYHVLNIARPDPFQYIESEGIFINCCSH